MAAGQRSSRLMVAFLVLSPVIVWGAYPATAVTDADEVQLSVSAKEHHRSVHEWSVGFNTLGPGVLYDIHPFFNLHISGNDLEGGSNDGNLEVRLDMFVNGELDAHWSIRNQAAGGGVGVERFVEWDEDSLRRGYNAVTFVATVTNEPSPTIKGAWKIDLGPARVDVHGAP